MRMCTRVVLLTVATLVAARSVQAQPVALADSDRAGMISAGAFVGFEFDKPDHVLVGGDGRISFGEINIELSPRYVFRPFANGSVQQIDVNFLTNHRLSNPGRFRPYSGAGVAMHTLRTTGAPSVTDLGINLISGVRLAMREGAAYEPFLAAQYTVMKTPANSFSVVVGTSFSFR